MKRSRAVWLIAMPTVVGLAAAGCAHASRSAAPLGDHAIQAVDVVARGGGVFQHPRDAVPSADGSVIYFTATTSNGPAVLRVAAAGGAVSTLTQGAPLVNPTGIALSSDSGRIFVADPAEGTGGAIVTLAATAGPQTPVVVAGTAGRSPRGLDVVSRGGTDVIYFTGTDPANGAAGLFTVPASGGAVDTVAQGSTFTAPDSVVVASGGTAYVSDQGTGSGRGEVFGVAGGRVMPVLTNLNLGTPGGVTLVDHDAVLLVSSQNRGNGSDQVLFLDLATGRTATASKVIGLNMNSSGGLHAAGDSAVAAWADTQGTIYRVRFP